MLDRIEFLFSEAFTALRRNTWMSFAAVTTTCVALFLLGGLGFAYIGVNQYAAQMPNKFEMRVFLRDKTTPAQVKDIGAKVRKIKGVSNAVFVARDTAWKRMQVEMPDVTKGIENPLPDSYNITLSDIDQAEGVAAAIKRFPEVEPDGVKYESETRELISQTLALLRFVGLTLGTLMLLTGAVLIYNAIRMTIVARRREIRIMRLVGATRLMVVTPLLIEGVVQGVIGGALASLLILGAHASLARVLENMAGFVKLGALHGSQVLGPIVLLGALYGLICSLVAVRDPRGID